MNPIRRRRLGGVVRDPVPPVQFRTFNGTSNALQSASTLDLTGVNKLTVSCWLWWDTFANNDKLALEFGASSSVAGSFTIDPNESSTGRFVAGVAGNTGFTNASYTRPSAAAWHHFAWIMDFSQAVNEVDQYQDGVLLTPVSRPSVLNNTGNFGNLALNVMSRNHASIFGAGRMARLAIWPGVLLSAGEVAALYTGTPIAQIQSAASPYYWPLGGTASPEPAADLRGINLTVF